MIQRYLPLTLSALLTFGPASSAAEPAQESTPEEHTSLESTQHLIEGLATQALADFESHDFRRRWVGIVVNHLDASGGDVEASTLAAALLADLVTRGRFGWGKPPWKFVVLSRTTTSAQVAALATGYNLAPKLWSFLIQEFSARVPSKSTIFLVITVVTLPGSEPLWIYTGAYRKKNGEVRAVYRTLNGSIRDAGERVLRYMKAAQ